MVSKIGEQNLRWKVYHYYIVRLLNRSMSNDVNFQFTPKIAINEWQIGEQNLRWKVNHYYIVRLLYRSMSNDVNFQFTPKIAINE